MARRGKFGRMPAAAPSLTSTIISIAREMANQEAQNISEAWAHGGLYEGKPVTDAMLLSFWKAKAAGISKDDPLYDAANNQYMQYDYAIHESKQALLYKQGKLSDAGMASFYLNWAKKIPVNSEFYRTLQKDAAGFLQASAAGGRASAAKGKAAAYDAFQTDTAKRYIGLSDTLTSMMTQVARDNNLIAQNQDLTDFMLKGQNDPGRMESLLSQITADMKANPAAYAGVIKAIKVYDPHFDGNLTSAYFAQALGNSIKGYTMIQTRALADGYTSNAKAAGKAAVAANSLGTEVRSWPMATAYSNARAQFDAVWNSPAATDADKAFAASRFATSIDGFAKVSGLDPAMVNRLQTDAAALRGDPNAASQASFYENYLGMHDTAGQVGTGSTTSEGGSQAGENAKFQQDVARIDFWKQQYDANPAAYVYASYKLDGQGNPVYDPTGQGQVGIVPIASVVSAPGKNNIVPVPTITGGAIMQVVSQQDIVLDDPNNSSKHTVVGSSMTYNQGGRTITLYGVPRPDGAVDWTPVAPWAAGINETVKPDGIHLTVNPAALNPDNAGTAAGLDQQFGTHVAAAFADGKVPVEGTKWTTTGTAANGSRTDTTVTFRNGQLEYAQTQFTLDAKGKETASVVSPSQVANPIDAGGAPTLVWDQARIKAGPNPAIDFTTPMIAGLVASQASGNSVVEAWQNPQFQAQLQQQEIALANGDQNKLNQIVNVDMGIARHLTSFGQDANIPLIWQRDVAQSRRDLIVPSIVTANANGQPTIKTGNQLLLPALGVFGQQLVGTPSDTLSASAAALKTLGAIPVGATGAPVTPTAPANLMNAAPTAAPVTPAIPSATPTPKPAPLPITPVPAAVAPLPVPGIDKSFGSTVPVVPSLAPRAKAL